MQANRTPNLGPRNRTEPNRTEPNRVNYWKTGAFGNFTPHSHKKASSASRGSLRFRIYLRKVRSASILFFLFASASKPLNRGIDFSDLQFDGFFLTFRVYGGDNDGDGGRSGHATVLCAESANRRKGGGGG